jgi:hypothetical protein
MKAFHVAFRNELRERQLPRFLPMGGEPATFLRIHPQLPRHLDVQIAQVKALLGVRPGVKAGFGLLHDVSFCGQPAAGRATAVSRRLSLP